MPENRKARFVKETRKQNKQKVKYYICCAPENECTGDLRLAVDETGLLALNPKETHRTLFPVHSTQKDSQECSQRAWSK